MTDVRKLLRERVRQARATVPGETGPIVGSGIPPQAPVRREPPAGRRRGLQLPPVLRPFAPILERMLEGGEADREWASFIILGFTKGWGDVPAVPPSPRALELLRSLAPALPDRIVKRIEEFHRVRIRGVAYSQEEQVEKLAKVFLAKSKNTLRRIQKPGVSALRALGDLKDFFDKVKALPPETRNSLLQKLSLKLGKHPTTLAKTFNRVDNLLQTPVFTQERINIIRKSLAQALGAPTAVTPRGTGAVRGVRATIRTQRTSGEMRAPSEHRARSLARAVASLKNA